MYGLSDEEWSVLEDFFGDGSFYEHEGAAEVRLFYLLESDFTTHKKIKELKTEFLRFMIYLKGEEW